MRINLKKSTADKIKLNLRMSQGKKTEILFDLKRSEAYFDRNNSDGWSKGVARCPLNLMGKEHLDIHIYSDKISFPAVVGTAIRSGSLCQIFKIPSILASGLFGRASLAPTALAQSMEEPPPKARSA